MPELVINTGPLIALTAALGDLTILDELYDRVVIPQEVFCELEAGGIRGAEVALLHRLRSVEFISEATPLPALLAAELDAGEASVIQTAIARKIPLVAIDEKQGRRMARLNQLRAR
jgi:predicted nucleic acid-binding protein